MIAWLNPMSGLSGDMLLAALIDVGAPLAAITEAVASTGLTGWELDVSETTRQGLRARRVRVVADDAAAARHAGELLDIAARAQPAPVAVVAVAAVRAMAEVEAGIHGVPVAEVHLHELGGIDTIVDVVGVAAALHSLQVTQVWSAPVRLGAGETGSAHGLLPVPAPATVALLRGVPVVGIDSTAETVTPTGAALLLAVGTRFGAMPAMTIAAVGYGAGSRDTPGRPNMLPLLLGAAESVGAAADSAEESMIVVETTVDDLTGEVLGQLVERLLASGAADAWLVPVFGKKGRPAHVVTALCHHTERAAVEETMLRETGSLGLRRIEVGRRALSRSTSTVVVNGAAIRVKSGPHRAKPEYDDLQRLAQESGQPLRQVADDATARLAETDDDQPVASPPGPVSPDE